MGLIDCQKADGLLIELLYAELDDAEARSVREHMSSCVRCEAVFADLSATASMAARLPEEEPSAQLSYDILREARKAASPPSPQNALSALGSLLLRPAFGSALLLCLVGGSLFLFREAGIDRPTVERSDEAMRASEPDSLSPPAGGQPSPSTELPAAPALPAASPRAAEPPAADARDEQQELAAPAQAKSPAQGDELKARGIKQERRIIAALEKRSQPAASAERRRAIRSQQKRLGTSASGKGQKPEPRTIQEAKDSYLDDRMGQRTAAPAKVPARAAPSMVARGGAARGDSPAPRRKAAKRRAERPSVATMDQAPPQAPSPAPSPAPMASAAPAAAAAPAPSPAVERMEREDEIAPKIASQARSREAAAGTEEATPRQRLAMAKALLQQGEARRASQSLRALLKTLPSRDVLASETRHQLGRAQLAQKRLTPAVNLLRAAFNDERYPDRQAAKQDLLRGLEAAAAEAEKAGRSPEALRLWAEIARLEPRQKAKADRATRRLQAPTEIAPAVGEPAPAGN